MHRVASKTIKINHGRRNECLPWRITGYVIVKYSIITVKKKHIPSFHYDFTSNRSFRACKKEVIAASFEITDIEGAG